MLYCPTCNNVLDISKTIPKTKSVSNQTRLARTTEIQPLTITDTDGELTQKDVDAEKDERTLMIENIIKKLVSGETVGDDTFVEVKMSEILKNKAFQRLGKKKQDVLAKLALYYDKIDDATNAYYICKNCLYNEEIKPGTLLMSKISNDTSTKYINLTKLKNRVHNKVLPITRNYICINKSCKTNDSKNPAVKEAVFYRIGSNMQSWYTCKVCSAYWKGQ